MGFRTAAVVSSTCFILGLLLMGLARADYPILYGKTTVTSDDIGRAERYYLTLFNAPGAVSALLHAMIGVCLLGLSSKFAAWQETNLFFDGSCLALMVAAISLYATVTIPNLRTLALQPIAEQQITLGGRMRAWLHRPMASPAEAQLVPELTDGEKYEVVSLICASNNLIIGALVGVLLFQAAQGYAHRQFDREMKKIREAEKAQKKE